MYEADIKNVLRYDAETGLFHWLINTKGRGGAIKIDDVAGTLGGQGYVQIKALQKLVKAHRLAYLFMMGEWPTDGMDIDHINGNRSDNRWANLRLATRSQNNANGGVRKDSKSGVRGVSWQSKHNKWDARITVDKKTTTLGLFVNLEDAIAARKKSEKELCPEWTPALPRKARLRHS